jgi:hypothetical protein
MVLGACLFHELEFDVGLSKIDGEEISTAIN